jgi:hypothetical protein
MNFLLLKAMFKPIEIYKYNTLNNLLGKNVLYFTQSSLIISKFGAKEKLQK